MSILCESCPCTRLCGECKEKECKRISLMSGRGFEWDNKAHVIHDKKESGAMFVKVTSEMGKTTNCICDFCHDSTRVIKLMIPETKFFDGYKLTTKYTPMWLCKFCRDALRTAIDLEFPKEENA